MSTNRSISRTTSKLGALDGPSPGAADRRCPSGLGRGLARITMEVCPAKANTRSPKEVGDVCFGGSLVGYICIHTWSKVGASIPLTPSFGLVVFRGAHLPPA